MRTNHYADTCRRDMKMAGNDINNWENVVSDRGNWRSIVKDGMKGEKIEICLPQMC